MNENKWIFRLLSIFFTLLLIGVVDLFGHVWSLGSFITVVILGILYNPVFNYSIKARGGLKQIFGYAVVYGYLIITVVVTILLVYPKLIKIP